MLASAVAVVIFRGELALLLGTAAAADLFVGRKIRSEIAIIVKFDKVDLFNEFKLSSTRSYHLQGRKIHVATE